MVNLNKGKNVTSYYCLHSTSEWTFSFKSYIFRWLVTDGFIYQAQVTCL